MSRFTRIPRHSVLLAYVVGAALGDGNLTNPNGRATRLRITCNAKYPILAGKIRESLKALFPHNRVSVVPRAATYFDISCYSNHLESLLGWRVGKGTKVEQRIGVPAWIRSEEKYTISCLRGLLETDGTVYVDRGYPMVMFTTAVPRMATHVHQMMTSLGFAPHSYAVPHRYTVKKAEATRQVLHVRLSRRVQDFLDRVRPTKE